MMRAPNTTERSPYYIPKHRYYELMHFCRQYDYWKKRYGMLVRTYQVPSTNERVVESKVPVDVTVKLAMARAKYSSLINMIESSADETDPVIGAYILKGVTKGRSYEELNAEEPVPCCRTDYYKLRQKFFYILDKKRD